MGASFSSGEREKITTDTDRSRFPERLFVVILLYCRKYLRYDLWMQHLPGMMWDNDSLIIPDIYLMASLLTHKREPCFQKPLLRLLCG